MDGLVEDESLNWLKQELKLGDTIGIRVIDADTVDSPKKRRRETPEQAEKRERAYYEHLKQKYEE